MSKPETWRTRKPSCNYFRAGNWYFYLLFCAALALTWFFHRDATRFNDRTEIWSDRAGYYIYLPAAFFYHFDARSMPADLDVATGAGFSLDTVNNKIDTKYTYGVALMASPFFFTAHLVSRMAGLDDENGFSMLYVRMMHLAAVIYLVLGLWFLKKFLDNYFDAALGYFVITLLFLGTNLFYYSLADGMMSHVYSFFLFALFLHALVKFLQTGKYGYFLLMVAAYSLAVLIRPTNIILGLLFFTWDAESPRAWLVRLKAFFRPKYWLVFPGIFILVFLPQMIYWNYLSGHLLHFSYGDEGFNNLFHPKIAEVLLSPVNGLFAYTPLALVFVAGILLMLFRKKQNGWLIAFLFLVVTLICASWKMWYFGCSFGQRSFIEYYTLLAVPFGWFTVALFKCRRGAVAVLLFFAVFFFAWVNLRFTFSLYRFERCYYGSTWDSDHYRRTLERAGILAPVRQVQSYENDFENLALSPVVRPSQVFTRSGLYSIAAMEKGGFTPLFTTRLESFGHPFPKRMEVEAWMLRPGSRLTGASLVYTLSRGSEVLFGDDLPVDSALNQPMTWQRISKTFIIPDVYDSTLQISIFLANPHRYMMFVDDLKVHYRYKWD